jgi:hypothetical protein
MNLLFFLCWLSLWTIGVEIIERKAGVVSSTSRSLIDASSSVSMMTDALTITASSNAEKSCILLMENGKEKSFIKVD